MSKKWEKAQPVVLDYLDNNPNCYLNDIVDALNLSAYVISTAFFINMLCMFGQI